MGRAAAEDLVGRRTKLLVLVAGVVSSVLSALYVLTSITPLLYFHGYVRGHFSLLDCRLYYSHSGQPVYMPHADYIRHVSIVFAFLSAALLGASLSSLALARRRTLLASGLAYGASSGLIVLYGLLGGYIGRAVGLDLGRFSHLVGRPNNEVVYRTLAGTITFEGVVIGRAPVYDLVLASPIPLVLLAVAVASSAVATGMVLRSAHATAPTGRPSLRPPGFRKLSAYTSLFLTTFSLLASVFTYYPSSIALAPQPPPATLEPPPYAYTCTVLARARRALAYTDFETYPLLGWARSGGSWSTVGGVAGAKGNVLRGSDDGRGLGAASHYYYNTDLSTYTSLWVVSKTRWVSGTGYYGISMMNTGRSRLYEIAIYRDTVGRGYLEIWSFNVIAPPANRWVNHSRVTIPGYTSTAWYVLVVHYSVVGTTITISAYLYDASGGYVTGASATISHANVFRPAYIGVTVDGTTAYFDDFIISITDPRSISFSGFYTGMRVEVWDNLGLLVNSTVAPASSFHLNVRADVVVGTGVNGRIVVGYPDAFPCLDHRVPATDAILGGDSYSLAVSSYGLSYTLGANKTSAIAWVYVSYSWPSVTVARFLSLYSPRAMYARLVLVYYETRDTLYANVTVIGRTESTPIVVRAGTPVTTATSFVELSAGPANYLAVRGYYMVEPATQVSRLDLKLELCTLPDGRGACVSYPVQLVLVGYVKEPAPPSPIPTEGAGGTS